MMIVWLLVALLAGVPDRVVVDNISTKEECYALMARMGMSGGAMCIPVEKRFVP